MQAIHDRPLAFAPSECAAILELAEAREGRAAPLSGYDGEVVDPTRRSARTVLVGRDDESAWLFDRLDALFAEAGRALDLPVDPLASPTFKTAATSYEGGAATGAELTEGAATIDTNLRRRLIANEVLVLTLSRDKLVVANPRPKQ